MGFIDEFLEFLKEYNAMALAIAFIIATAATALVRSLVDDLIMPVITPFVPGGAWETATLTLGPIVLKWGSFLSALINFAILAMVVFIVAKKVLKHEKVKKM